MRVLGEFLHLYFAPFMAGVSLAATTVLHGPPLVALALVLAGLFGFLTLPAGGRVIRRVAGSDAEA